MSDQDSQLVVRIWKAIVLVVLGLLRAIGAALLFGQWCFGVGLLLGLLVGGMMALTTVGHGAALLFGPLVGAGIGAAIGAVFGLVAGAFYPDFVDRVAQHPMFNVTRSWTSTTQTNPQSNSTSHASEEEALANNSQQGPPTNGRETNANMQTES